jgi:S1-C subfamily serine protease
VVQQGGRFPASMVLDGGGSGVAVSAGGHVLTNHHLVVGEVEQAGRKSGSIDSEQPCRHLRVQVARPDEKRGGWQWVDAERALLVSNPAESDAYRASPDPRYRYRLHADLALLRIEPAPAHWLPLSRRVPTIGESVWMAGCPLRTARRSARYRDADASLRVSMGKVLALGTDEPDGEGFIVTDVDGAAGSSGSPLFDAHGRIIGLFSRVLDGASSRNAVEYDAVRRVHVPASMIEPLLGSGLPAFSD